MKAVIQRVKHAEVAVDGQVSGSIGSGLLVYLGVAGRDDESDARFIADKLAHLRIFADENGKMNLGIAEVSGSILLVSQFTLLGDCRKGRRPGFDQAARPDQARNLYQYTIELLRHRGINVQTGIFAAHMQVSSVNDGPVTFILESPDKI